MTIEQQSKLAAHLQRLLKVRHVSFPVAKTEKGDLSIKYTKDTDGYEIILDAVPLDQKDYDNRELKSLLEKYLFEPESSGFAGLMPLLDDSTIEVAIGGVKRGDEDVTEKILGKKPGRPKKVK